MTDFPHKFEPRRVKAYAETGDLLSIGRRRAKTLQICRVCGMSAGFAHWSGIGCDAATATTHVAGAGAAGALPARADVAAETARRAYVDEKE